LDERKGLRLRRDDACSNCGCNLAAGTWAYWVKTERVVLCAGCSEPSVPVEPPPVEDTAGASARRIHEQRRQSRAQRQREKYGRIGGWAARVSAGPQHERAWATGAEGEEENAKRWQKLLADMPVRILHDRRLPGTRANVDHIGIGPGGVTVVDSKKLSGKVRTDWRGGLFAARRFDLYVNGRRRTGLVESVERQVETIRVVLAEEGFDDVGVLGALCMADPTGLPLVKRLKVRDVAIDGPRPIAKLMARPGVLDVAGIERVAAVLNRRLPAA
jgi:hypothetical protein